MKHLRSALPPPRSFFSFLVFSFSAFFIHAQTYILDNGAAVPAAAVKVSGADLVQALADGAAERRFPIANIARLDFPEPPELAETAALITSGQSAQALYKIEPVYRQFAPFSKLPGSYWSEAAILRLRALLLPPNTKADPKAAEEAPARIRAAAREIMSTSTDPEAIGEARLALAELDIRSGRPEMAVAMLNEIVRDAPGTVKARAWLLRGDLAMKRNAYEEALDAYLRIPALFGTLDDLMPAALLGSARAYKGYGDKDRAERAYLDLLDNYKTTPQATAAKAESGL
ncbi:tetratricopeptide repeat protein [Geminisphaera colitermitum]|uniref:tetratricopeptide repeat protein n=1 Tax=Geminisphaera colitermitum TaxID=1148786 RepID=UPI0006941374|nr:tetratricopeptide repeat protein [Geminisphaera colitermitum]